MAYCSKKCLLEVETVRYQCLSVRGTFRYWCRTVRTLRHQSDDDEMSGAPGEVHVIAKLPFAPYKLTFHHLVMLFVTFIKTTDIILRSNS